MNYLISILQKPLDDGLHYHGTKPPDYELLFELTATGEAFVDKLLVTLQSKFTNRERYKITIEETVTEKRYFDSPNEFRREIQNRRERAGGDRE